MSPDQWTNAELEEFVAQRFCAHLGNAYAIQEHRDKPDFIITDGSKHIGLEITRYRTPGPENDAEELDRRIKDFIRSRWLNDETVNHWNACLYYRLETSRQGRPFYRLPRTEKEKQAFVEELKNLVRQLSPTTSSLSFHFVDDGRAGLLERLGCDNFVREQDYPTLSRFCYEVVLHHTQSALVGLTSTNFNAGKVGIDENALMQRVEEKLERLLGYRDNLPGLPIWLLIYNEGDAITRRVESHKYREIIVATVTRLQRRRDQRFDAVWWGTNVMLDGPSSPEFMEIS